MLTYIKAERERESKPAGETPNIFSSDQKEEYQIIAYCLRSLKRRRIAGDCSRSISALGTSHRLLLLVFIYVFRVRSFFWLLLDFLIDVLFSEVWYWWFCRWRRMIRLKDGGATVAVDPKIERELSF